MENKNLIQIFEHQKLRVNQYNCFKQKHFELLVKYNEKNVNKFFDIGYNSILFKEYVGVIQVAGTTIEILPKADKRNDSQENKNKWQKILFDMLKGSRHIKIKSISSANLKLRSNSILDLYFEIFIAEIEYILRSGLVKKYRRNSDNLNVLKGGLNISKQISKNTIHKERFFTNYTVYDKNHLLHKIIFKTLYVIDKINKSSYLKDRLNRLFLDFPHMENISVNNKTFETLKFDRKTKRYEKAINIAKLILLNYSPDIISGKDNVLALLFNMNDLWEEFVLIKLKKYARKYQDIKVFGQSRKRFWNYRLLIPDIVICKEDKTFIIDTKWKNIRHKNVSTEDLRQVFAYNEFWKAKNGMLLYPDINGISDFEGEYKNKEDRHSCKVGFVKVGRTNDGFAETILEKIIKQEKEFA
ncbi:MAG: restriction endonuclease [Bacteroidota bacterium]|nr:restriction endonuclease [Bacteroidota bacterium]